jgi:FkbM family methyltransferase
LYEPKVINEINNKMEIFNEFGQSVVHYEIDEQYLAKHFIKDDDVVLELGARYGAVSCTINGNLKNKYNQVVVEPDQRVWEILEKNKINNNCQFHIVKGFISNEKLSLNGLESFNGYSTYSVIDEKSTIPSYTLEEIKNKYNLIFNVLVADCEGFLEKFFDENPELYDTLRLVIFEADRPDICNYDKIRDMMAKKGFRRAVGGMQNVWLKE